MSVEALIPGNKQTGSHVGVIAQFHLYFDDLFPTVWASRSWIGGTDACDRLLALAMLSAASPAFAHAMLERASPPVGSEVASRATEISLTFTEGVEPLFSTIELRGADGAAISTGKPHVGTGNNRQLVVELPELGSRAPTL